MIQRPTGRRCQQVLHATIGYVGLPKPGRNGEAFVRAELPNCPDGPKALFLSGGALRRYFYLLDGDEPQSLYRLLRVSDIGEYPPPTNYYFAASKGLGLKLKKLLTKPEELKKAVVTNWDKHCKKKITDTKELPLEGTLLEYLNKFDFALRHTLGDRARQSIVDAIFADAKAGNVPHQWEVKEGFECGKNNDCSKESPDKTCKRDTSTDTCYSW